MQVEAKLKKICFVCMSLLTGSLLFGFLLKSQTSLIQSLKRSIDLLTTLILLFCIRLSNKPPNSTFTYGYLKAQPIGCLLNTIIVFVGVLHYLIDLFSPEDPNDIGYDDTRLEMIGLYVIGISFEVLVKMIVNRRDRVGGPRVGYIEEEVETLQIATNDSQTKKSKKGTKDSKRSPYKSLHFNEFSLQQSSLSLPIHSDTNCLVLTHNNLIIATVNFRVYASILLYIHLILSQVVAKAQVDVDGVFEYGFNIILGLTMFIFILIGSTSIVRRAVRILLDGFIDTQLFGTVIKQLRILNIQYSDLKFWSTGFIGNCASITVRDQLAKKEVARVFQEKNIDVTIEYMQT